jgi:thymidylate synthase (FAD)
METKRSTVPAAEEILGLYFPVLDHGFVSLVDYMGGDAAVEQAARVSFGPGARNVTETRGLLRYLHRHGHTSPNEMVEFKFHCSMPIFVARQWIRHRTANVNEVSGRYSVLPMLFYTPSQDQLRSQSTVNKQGRDDAVISDSEIVDKTYEGWRSVRDEAVAQYKWLNDNDFARELARIDLPLSTYTQWYWKIDLHNLLHFLTLRVDAHAQWEIQQFGKVMGGMLKRVAPLSYEAWVDYDVCGARLSRAELDLARALYVNVGYEIPLDDLLRDPRFARPDMSPREMEEFVALFTDRDVPDFELDLAKAKPAKFFENMAAAAAPKSAKSSPSTTPP